MSFLCHDQDIDVNLRQMKALDFKRDNYGVLLLAVAIAGAPYLYKLLRRGMYILNSNLMFH